MFESTDRITATSMSELLEREELLESSGYLYYLKRMLYVNGAGRRAFNIEFVESHSREEIQEPQLQRKADLEAH